MYIGVSFATASKLKLVKFKFNNVLPTFYFILGKRCVYDCAFCTHARSSKASLAKLSRITWPVFPLELVSKKMESFLNKNSKEVKRICIQVVSERGYEGKLIKVIKELRKFNLPISVSVRPKSFDEIKEYFELGIERIGIALDAATEKIFKGVRGGSWERTIELIKQTVKHFSNRVSTHLIVGLGETEKEAVNFIFMMKKLGVEIALFAFTPIKGTKMENHPRPSLESYRRIQLAKFLVYTKNIKPDDISYTNDEKIKRFKMNVSNKEELLKAFLTSGCDFCNRPFYNESPNGLIYNIPYQKMLKKLDSSYSKDLFVGGK